MGLDTHLLAAASVSPADAATLVDAYRQVGGPARYWRSPSYLAGDKANRLAVVDGCTVVVRAKVLHARVVAYLLFPPLGGTVADQGNVLAACRDAGFGAKLSAYDVDLYGVDADPHVGNLEWVYRGPAPSGRRGQARRTGLARLRRDIEAGRVVLHDVDRPDADLAAGCLALAQRWREQRGVGRGVAPIIKAFAQVHAGRQHTYAVTNADTGHVIGLSLTEWVGPGSAARIVAIHDYGDPLAKQVGHALHELDCQLWDGHDLNMGSAMRGRGIADHKALLAGGQVQLYDAAPAVQLTLDDYRAAAKQLTLEGV